MCVGPRLEQKGLYLPSNVLKLVTQWALITHFQEKLFNTGTIVYLVTKIAPSNDTDVFLKFENLNIMKYASTGL